MIKVITIVILFLALGVAAFLYWGTITIPDKESQPADLSRAVLDLDLIDSPIERIAVPNVDIQLPEIGEFGFRAEDIPDSRPLKLDIKPPTVNIK